MNTELFERVRRFVADDTGCSWKEIGPETTLLGDLYIDGDDADELFIGFAKTFNVDLGELDLSRYFHSESESFCSPMELVQLLWDTVRGRARFSSDTSGKIPVRIKDLVQAAVEGKWQNLPQTLAIDKRIGEKP